MIFIWELVILLHQYRVGIWLEWIPTYLNVAADALSRFQIKRFHQLANNHGWFLDPKPT